MRCPAFVAAAIVEQSGEDRRAFLVFVERIPKTVDSVV
jgi:hypothetical protein